MLPQHNRVVVDLIPDLPSCLLFNFIGVEKMITLVFAGPEPRIFVNYFRQPQAVLNFYIISILLLIAFPSISFMDILPSFLTACFDCRYELSIMLVL